MPSLGDFLCGGNRRTPSAPLLLEIDGVSGAHRSGVGDRKLQLLCGCAGARSIMPGSEP